MISHPASVRSVTIGSATVSFREAGNPGGPHTVLLHGGASSSATWHRLSAALAAEGHHVVAPDLRGHGASTRAPGYPLAGFADDISGLLDALDIASAALVGHSLGGYVAARIAQQQPARIGRLVLEEPGLPARDVAGSNGLSGPRFLLAAVAGLVHRRGFDRKAVISAVRQLRAPDPAWWDGLASVTATTLVISGGPASHIPPQLLAEVAGSIGGSQLVSIPAGHRVHSKSPEQFLAAVLPFLTG